MKIGEILTQMGVFMARPTAFLIVLAYVLIWALTDRESLNLHGGATIATWLMTLFIQRAEHRDTQAIHAKLDELLHASGRARDELTSIDDQEPEAIEAHRKAENNGDAKD